MGVSGRRDTRLPNPDDGSKMRMITDSTHNQVIRGSNNDTTGLPNPDDESYSEATMMTRKSAAAAQKADSGRADTGLPNPDGMSMSTMMGDTR